jgi:hypothetical protein
MLKKESEQSNRTETGLIDWNLFALRFQNINLMKTIPSLCNYLD